MRVYSIPLVISLSFILFSADSPKLRTETSNSFNPFREKAAAARAYAHQHGLSTAVCFLADMQLPSGQNRFFVYDLAGDSVRGSGLVTHGRCNESWLEGRRYGNVPGCGCTSLGKYRVGTSYQGRFGLAFKLYGLEKTNDKAFERFVVLHSHTCVPGQPTEEEICQSDGCPTVAPGFLRQLRSLILAADKPILLWVFDEGNK